MKKYLEILKKCVLFDGVDEENIIPMLCCLDAKVETFDKRETVFPEGGEARLVGIVLSGKVQIERCDVDGNRGIVGITECADMFGESFACAGVRSLPVSVIAAEKSELLLIDCKKIITSCSNSCEFHNKMIYNLLKTTAEKNLRFNKRLEILSRRSTREKLMAYLGFCAREKNSRKFKIPFDRQELADYLAVDRSGLSAEIGKLVREGVIECDKSEFTLI